MYRYDRKVFKAIKKFSKNRFEPMRYYEGELQFYEVSSDSVRQSVKFKFNPFLFDGAVGRLCAEGFLRYDTKYLGGYTFCITDKLVLSRQIWWDGFTKKFIGGFVAGVFSGIAVTVISELLIPFLRSLIGI